MKMVQYLQNQVLKKDYLLGEKELRLQQLKVMVKEIKAVMVMQKALVMREFIVLNTLLLKKVQPTN